MKIKEVVEKCNEILEEPNNLSPEMKDFFETVRELARVNASSSLCPTESCLLSL